MQAKASKTKTEKVDISLERKSGITRLIQSAVSAAVILHPKVPADQLAQQLIQQADEELRADLAEILTGEFYVRAIIAERRRKHRTDSPQMVFPGFEHLPREIPVGEGKRVRLLSAKIPGVRAYYKFLVARHQNRLRDDPQIKEAKALLEEMTKRGKDVTVREILEK